MKGPLPPKEVHVYRDRGYGRVVFAERFASISAMCKALGISKGSADNYFRGAQSALYVRKARYQASTGENHRAEAALLSKKASAGFLCTVERIRSLDEKTIDLIITKLKPIPASHEREDA